MLKNHLIKFGPKGGHHTLCGAKKKKKTLLTSVSENVTCRRCKDMILKAKQAKTRNSQRKIS